MATHILQAPNWASGNLDRSVPPDVPTEFELKVEEIGVKPEFYVYSQPLKDWVRKNRYRRYVPEWLLGKWGMEVRNEDVSWTL